MSKTNHRLALLYLKNLFIMIETNCLYTVCWCQRKIESIYQKFSYNCLECTLARSRHSGKHLVKRFYFGGYINISSRRCVTSTDGIFIIHQTRWFYFRKYRKGHTHIHTFIQANRHICNYVLPYFCGYRGMWQCQDNQTTCVEMLDFKTWVYVPCLSNIW